MRRFRILVVAAAVALLGGVAAVVVAPPAFAAGETATFVKTSDWGSGWEGKYTVTNGGTTTLNGWAVAFDLPAGTSVGSFWDADMTRSGQRFTFRNKSWNGTLAPGASASFGFIGAGPGSPEQLHAQRRLLRRRRARSADPRRTGRAVASPAPPRSSIRSSWGASSGTVTGYRVYEGSTVRATVTGTTATIGGLGRQHHPHVHGRRLQQRRRVGPQRRRSPATTAGTGPQVPGHAGQRPGDRHDGVAISLAWNASTGTVTGYRVYEGSHGAGDRHRHDRDDRRPARVRVAAPTPWRRTTRSASRPAARAGQRHHHRVLRPARCRRTSSPATGTTSSTRPSSCGCATCPAAYDLVAVAFAEATAHARRGHLRRRQWTVRRARRLQRRRLPRRRRRRCTAGARRSSSPSAARPAGSPSATPRRRTNFSNTHVRPDPVVRLRRRRHRPGERPQPDVHGAGAAQPAQPGRRQPHHHDGAADHRHAEPDGVVLQAGAGHPRHPHRRTHAVLQLRLDARLRPVVRLLARARSTS